jgi:hypothetical protein
VQVQLEAQEEQPQAQEAVEAQVQVSPLEEVAQREYLMGLEVEEKIRHR